MRLGQDPKGLLKVQMGPGPQESQGRISTWCPSDPGPWRNGGGGGGRVIYRRDADYFPWNYTSIITEHAGGAER